MPPTLTFDVFVSYAAADRAWVEGFLPDALDTAGVRLHTEDAFALGVPRLVEFERAIQQSTRTLLVLSPAYLADSFGQFVDVLVNSYGMETATWPVIPRWWSGAARRSSRPSRRKKKRASASWPRPRRWLRRSATGRAA